MERRSHRPIVRLFGVVGLVVVLLGAGLGGLLPAGRAAADTRVAVQVANTQLVSDLTVQPGSSWLEVSPGHSALHFTVVNQGRRGAGQFSVRVWEAPDNADGGLALSTELPGLGPGASVPLVTGNILPSDWLASGHFKAIISIAALNRTTGRYENIKTIDVDLAL
jgi:hypothetical protein